MSHTVTIQTKVRDPVAIATACHRLGLAAPVEGSARLFSSRVSGLLVQLPDWRFPIVIDAASGEVKFDNFSGHWGAQEHLDRFLQMYAVEKAKLEARKQGHSTSEQNLADGSIKVQIITIR